MKTKTGVFTPGWILAPVVKLWNAFLSFLGKLLELALFVIKHLIQLAWNVACFLWVHKNLFLYAALFYLIYTGLLLLWNRRERVYIAIRVRIRKTQAYFRKHPNHRYLFYAYVFAWIYWWLFVSWYVRTCDPNLLWNAGVTRKPYELYLHLDHYFDNNLLHNPYLSDLDNLETAKAKRDSFSLFGTSASGGSSDGSSPTVTQILVDGGIVVCKQRTSSVGVGKGNILPGGGGGTASSNTSPSQNKKEEDGETTTTTSTTSTTTTATDAEAAESSSKNQEASDKENEDEKKEEDKAEASEDAVASSSGDDEEKKDESDSEDKKGDEEKKSEDEKPAEVGVEDAEKKDEESSAASDDAEKKEENTTASEEKKEDEPAVAETESKEESNEGPAAADGDKPAAEEGAAATSALEVHVHRVKKRRLLRREKKTHEHELQHAPSNVVSASSLPFCDEVPGARASLDLDGEQSAFLQVNAAEPSAAARAESLALEKQLATEYENEVAKMKQLMEDTMKNLDETAKKKLKRQTDNVQGELDLELARAKLQQEKLKALDHPGMGSITENTLERLRTERETARGQVKKTLTTIERIKADARLENAKAQEVLRDADKTLQKAVVGSQKMGEELAKDSEEEKTRHAAEMARQKVSLESMDAAQDRQRLALDAKAEVAKQAADLASDVRKQAADKIAVDLDNLQDDSVGVQKGLEDVTAKAAEVDQRAKQIAEEEKREKSNEAEENEKILKQDKDLVSAAKQQEEDAQKKVEEVENQFEKTDAERKMNAAAAIASLTQEINKLKAEIKLQSSGTRAYAEAQENLSKLEAERAAEHERSRSVDLDAQALALRAEADQLRQVRDKLLADDADRAQALQRRSSERALEKVNRDVEIRAEEMEKVHDAKESAEEAEENIKRRQEVVEQEIAEKGKADDAKFEKERIEAQARDEYLKKTEKQVLAAEASDGGEAAAKVAGEGAQINENAPEALPAASNGNTNSEEEQAKKDTEEKEKLEKEKKQEAEKAAKEKKEDDYQNAKDEKEQAEKEEKQRKEEEEKKAREQKEADSHGETLGKLNDSVKDVERVLEDMKFRLAELNSKSDAEKQQLNLAAAQPVLTDECTSSSVWSLSRHFVVFLSSLLLLAILIVSVTAAVTALRLGLPKQDLERLLPMATANPNSINSTFMLAQARDQGHLHDEQGEHVGP
ncbi:unnamed protein product [Amoebophrya sp. A120]|nr:unnamed protein product [Amoebophrya sp. A120]|eukprot:GSA120T00019019001.1